MRREKEDKALRKAVGDLPDYTPSVDLWEDITSELEDATIEKKPQSGWFKYAAAAMLILSAGALWYGLIYTNTDISYGEELSDFGSEGQAVEVADAGFETFLEQECSGYRDVCEMPEFKTLITQLTEVEIEVTNITSMIETTGFDEFLYKAKTKADHETARIKKELVKLLRG